jgi:pimeloyl-ACP methyl ester carboxylesterase
METGYLELSGGRIFWRKWGAGQHLLICFHGFADSGKRFESLAGASPNSYTLIAPDLPWHGASEWINEDFRPADLAEIITEFSKMNEFTSCEILGHSWGGRLVIGTMPLLETVVHAAWIVAPGGFVKGLYWGLEFLPDFLRKPLIGFAEKKMGAFSVQMEFLGRIGLLNQTALRYLLRSLEKVDHQRQLFPVWKNLVRFRLNPKPLRNLNIPVVFLVGTKDSLISAPKVSAFSKQIPSSRFILLQDTGHWPDWASLADKLQLAAH